MLPLRAVLLGAAAVSVAGGTFAIGATTAVAKAGATASAACANPNALGVSRIIEIDTTGGPEYGAQQYKTVDPLQDGEVVLTFDDGPLRRNTRKVLRALEEHCTKAIFFAVGRMAVVDPVTLRAVADAGHTVGHHTWSHKNQRSRSTVRAIAELELGVSAIEAAIGRSSAPFFRFPYLADTRTMRAYLGERNFGIFSIDIDSFDWRSKSAARVRSTIMSKLRRKRKGILLFHDIQSSTANALPRLLNDIKAEGFRIVHMVPKTPTVSLPEYDRVAADLLKRKAYRHRARPLKTAFQFSGRARTVKKQARTSSKTLSTSSERSPDDVAVVQRAKQPRKAPLKVVPATQRPAARPRPKRPATVLRRVPDWRTSVFEE
ncbi:MAG: polysaccharide deacetylase family protein [Pseudomonadota bacterium]